jgi:replicative DNA helicase
MSFERFLEELTGKESKERKFSDGYGFNLTEFAEGLHNRFLLLLDGYKDWRFDDEPELAQEAYKYLQSRGFDLEDIRKYKIGFFYGKLREHKEIEGIDELVKKNSWIRTGECFLTFPIYDKDFSKVLNMQFENFMGRGSGENTKFFLRDIPITLWYSEKFNLSYSWVITEGIYDAMSMAKAGYCAIATLGTPITEVKIKQLKELEELILCFDNDNAGMEFTEKIKKELATTKIKVYEIKLPEGVKDANELLIKEQKEGIDKLEPVEVDFYPVWTKKINWIIERYEKSKEKAIPIPREFKFLDDIFKVDTGKGRGKLFAGLYALAGTPGVGKTTFLNQLCNELAKEKVYSIYFLSEEPEYVLLARTKIKEGFNSIRDLIGLDFLNYRITIEMSLEYRADKLKAIMEGILNRLNTDRALLVIDSLQALRLSGKIEEKMPLREKTILKTEYLANIVRDLQIPVIFSSFMAREFYNGTPSLSIFKESGDIEYLIDVGMALWRKEEDKKDNGDEQYVKLSVLKNRFGRLGEKSLRFDMKRMKFEEVY